MPLLNGKRRNLTQMSLCALKIPIVLFFLPIRSAVSGSSTKMGRGKLYFFPTVGEDFCTLQRLWFSSDDVFTLNIWLEWTFSWWYRGSESLEVLLCVAPLSTSVSDSFQVLQTVENTQLCVIWSKPNHTQTGLFVCTYETICEHGSSILTFY